MSDPRRNIELKARDPDPVRSRGTCRAIGAVPQGTLFQRDTYFDVRSGGLKLREESPGSPQLIQFERADEPQERESRYRIVGVAEADVETLRVALAAALSVRTVVSKRRELFIWREARIHLDEVEGLGSFIEFEAVAAHDSDLAREHRLITRLRTAFGVTDERLVGTGYAAQLLASGL